MGALPFDPDRDELRALLDAAGGLVHELATDRAERGPVRRPMPDPGLLDALVTDRPGAAVGLDEVLATVRDVLATGTDNGAGGDLGYIPGSGLVASAVAELLAASANRYTGLPGPNPAAVALEASVLAWLTELFDLPAGAQATLVSGGSAANLNALVAARERHAPDAPHLATVYVGEHAHASVLSSARTAGIRADHVRTCPTSDGLRLDPEAVRLAIKQDLADGLVPTTIVAAAGTTNAGVIDPLVDLAELAQDAGLWFHVDAAYGGFFQLTDRGRARLRGIDAADSITLDPHKSLFLPFGTGALLVRDGDDLRRAFAEDADYLRDLPDVHDLPDLSELTPELTRDWRGLKLWLPLKLHGVDTFRAALDDKLDLAAHAHAALASIDEVEVLQAPELSIVGFRLHGDDDLQDRALAAINQAGDLRLSSTVIAGRVVLRLAILSHRTDRETVDAAVARVRDVAAALRQ